MDTDATPAPGTTAEQFVEAVTRRDHPLHSAWVELNKPGYRRGWLVPKDEVQTLLEGIRQDFPALEARFDPLRVSAWEAKLYPVDMDSGGFQDVLTARGGLTLILAFGALRMGLVVFRMIHPHPSDHAAPQAVAVATPDATPDASRMALDAAAHRWFGPDTDFAGLGRMAPLVGRLAAGGAAGTADPAGADLAMRDAVFTALKLAVPHLDPPRLRAVQVLRARALAAAAHRDAVACIDFLTRGQLDDKVVLPAGTATAAASQVRAIAATGFYGNDPQPAILRASIPGSVIAVIIARTGLSLQVVRAALNHQGGNAAQCAVHRALIDQALTLPGHSGDAILRIE